MEHHTELKRILKEEAYLCTGHTYIVVDSSGSMRTSDVDCFRTRSHAAYGTLSLEFIAEQLSQRPNKDDLFAESVTVIEMKKEANVVFRVAGIFYAAEIFTLYERCWYRLFVSNTKIIMTTYEVCSSTHLHVRDTDCMFPDWLLAALQTYNYPHGTGCISLD